AIHECRDKSDKLLKEVTNVELDLVNNLSRFGGDYEAARNVLHCLDNCEDHLIHLLELFSIAGIITNDVERGRIVDIIDVGIKYRLKRITATIEYINKGTVSFTNNPALVSLCKKVKAELRKEQELLEYIDLIVSR
ncbi:MAG: hypothetical protein ACLQSX_06735, partial [Smithella sp.]